MIKLLDGPAAGIVLNCKRSPRYLRVVESPGMAPSSHRWDALDQLGDMPKPHETIHVYQWTKHVDCGAIHVYGVRNGSRFGEWRASAADHYRHLGWLSEELRESFRDNAAWRAWCIRQQEETDHDDDDDYA